MADGRTSTPLGVPCEEPEAREWGEAAWTAPDELARERQEQADRARRLMPDLERYGARPA